MRDVNDVLRAFETLIAETDRQADSGDYIQDGLLYCGRCGKPRQCRVTVLGVEYKPYCMCDCEATKYQQERAEEERRERMRRVQRLRETGFTDREMMGWTFDCDDGSNPKVSGVARRYVEHFGTMRESGQGLLLFGPVGTGKTFYAACIANALIDRGIPCCVTNFARLSNVLQQTYDGKQAIIDSMKEFDLLVIDDLGAERRTDYMAETVWSIIDTRYRSGLPLIVTTNMTAEELKHPADIRDERVFSRLYEMCLPVEVVGKDHRKGKLIDNHNNMKELLGL